MTEHCEINLTLRLILIVIATKFIYICFRTESQNQSITAVAEIELNIQEMADEFRERDSYEHAYNYIDEPSLAMSDSCPTYENCPNESPKRSARTDMHKGLIQCNDNANIHVPDVYLHQKPSIHSIQTRGQYENLPDLNSPEQNH